MVDAMVVGIGDLFWPVGTAHGFESSVGASKVVSLVILHRQIQIRYEGKQSTATFTVLDSTDEPNIGLAVCEL